MWKNDRFFEERKVTFTPEDCRRTFKIRQGKCEKLYSPKTGKTLQRNYRIGWIRAGDMSTTALNCRRKK